MIDEKKHVCEWNGSMDAKAWSDKARRATLLIEATSKGAQALLVDDAAGAHTLYNVPLAKLGELIGAAAESWVRGKHSGSFSVIVRHDPYSAGVISSPRPPPPPPGPLGDDTIVASTVLAHHQLLAASEIAVRHEKLGRVDTRR